ncbi:AAA family ATPase [Amycolatopsis saalfeldensis]|uniref:AAA ATPase domain-containing protein n=1 Tax=Amycolatopsis saalfeldensis TaxID=394193 RepID=A0A1H8R6V8_9PSEU|nr:AAA family ATPase [Amycolatopsis saalfeldensis]SEO62195.1 AAA ATPase domain-containing protein [Amycolatopsis saalfeldensis]
MIDSYSFGNSFSSLKPAESTEVPNLLLFIRAVQFRYIPNHARPADLIRQFAQPLRAELIKRLQGTQEYRQGAVADLMSALSRTGDQMFADVSASVGSGITNLSVNATLPTDFAELAFEVALQSVSNGRGRSPEMEGSGAQSFILLHILNLVDRVSRGRAFGWVQASIWAIEEPESFLHSGLRSRFATDLARYADDPRRQIFATTHQDEFVRVAPMAWIVSQGASGSRVECLPAKETLAKSTRMAITSYRHPLLEYPDIPIVVVEGRFDEIYLGAAVRETGIRPRWRILSPDDSFGDGTAGDALKSYLKFNQSALKARPLSAPILVLRDWESKDVGTYRNLLQAHPYSSAIATPESMTNPELGPSFVGIERYLGTKFVVKTIGRKDLLKRSNGDEFYEISKSTLSTGKRRLSDAVLRGEPAGTYLGELAKWLNGEVGKLVDQVPASEFVK